MDCVHVHIPYVFICDDILVLILLAETKLAMVTQFVNMQSH